MTKEEAIHCMKSYLPENTYETCMNCKYYGSCRSSVAHGMAIKALEQLEPYEDEDKLKRCRFEYINACKIVAHPTPDTSKNDIYDAHAVIKALNPIFGDEEF